MGRAVPLAIAPRDPNADGFLKWGRLEYVGEHYLKFRDGSYFIKTGTDSPENFLGYKGVDNTVDQGGAPTTGLENGLHRYGPHVADWGVNGLGDAEDPLFVSKNTGYDSRGIIGALNYLSWAHVNSIYFLPMNLGGDGQETYPFLNASGSAFDDTHYDVSKLDQWGEVFDHATRRGIMLHFVLAETEWANEHWLDNGNLGVERKLYYREMVARFGHALAIKWNLCEETDYSAAECLDFADYLQKQDPYDHGIAFHSHTLPSSGDNPLWTAVLGDPRFSMNSIQGFGTDAGRHVKKWRADSAAAGRKWVIDHDEQNESLNNVNMDESRKRALYDVLFSGGSIEWYAGYYTLPLGGDLRTEDFRQREEMWNYSWYARKLMENQMPFWEMDPAPNLVQGEAGDFGGAEVFRKVGDTYAIYYPNASVTGTLDLRETNGSFTARWYNPRTGLFEGSNIPITAGSVVTPGAPPSKPGRGLGALAPTLSSAKPRSEPYNPRSPRGRARDSQGLHAPRPKPLPISCPVHVAVRRRGGVLWQRSRSTHAGGADARRPSGPSGRRPREGGAPAKRPGDRRRPGL